jgi:hypothetical protein
VSDLREMRGPAKGEKNRDFTFRWTEKMGSTRLSFLLRIFEGREG